MNSSSSYFNENWQRYQNTLQNNTLYHREMMSTLNEFLKKNMGMRPFTFVDVGCGDSSKVVPVLTSLAISKYIGIDTAPKVLKMAEKSLAPLNCLKELLTEDMISAIPHLSPPVDIIFTSYAVHLLSAEDKVNFIKNCHQKLNSNGFL